MNKNRTMVVTILAAFCILASVFALGQDQAKTMGMIISRTGETLIVKGPDGKTTVVLDDYTETVDNKGLFGLEKQQMGSAVLIPGLKVTVIGTPDSHGRLLAKKIVVDGDDLETSEMIEAGLHPTAEQVAANVRTLETHQQRLGEHGTQLVSQKESIAANKQQIEQNVQDIEENTNRFMQLADYDVKAQATLKFKVGSSKIAPEDEDQAAGANCDRH